MPRAPVQGALHRLDGETFRCSAVPRAVATVKHPIRRLGERHGETFDRRNRTRLVEMFPRGCHELDEETSVDGETFFCYPPWAIRQEEEEGNSAASSP